jgi:hypothetical protein
MEEKRKFYEKYGAEEYYILYPDFPAYFQGWRREAEALARVPNMHGFVSPRLGIRFEVVRGQVAVFWPEGQPFLSYVELGALQQQTAERAEQERQRAERLAAKLRELGVDPDTV